MMRNGSGISRSVRAALCGLSLLPLSAIAANVEVSWTHPTSFEDGTPLTPAQIASTLVEYGTCSGTAFGAKLGEKSIPAPAAATTLTGFNPGTHCFRAATVATAAAGGGVSKFSNVATKTISWPLPNPPTITTVNTVARLLRPNGSLGKVAGYVPRGTACGELMVDPRKGASWYTVNREDVRLNKDGRKSTALIVARCSA